ncbi:MAG: rRNA cytosine-C5-methyltransferase [Muribaculaceae bacterium]|nr:rRNA cytosine-C5-methyltransferase [Muribaculaceae bacterium]
MTLPEGFAQMMQRLDNVNSNALIEALSQPQVVSIRTNKRKATAVPLYDDATPVAWCEDGVYLPSRPVFTLNPLMHAGCFYVQDASSMIYQTIATILTAQLRHDDRPLHILDLCAAPGGKTTAIINALADHDIIVANEYVPARAAVLRENIAKWGFPGAAVTNASAEILGRCGELFDIVAVDAPCSGEGMMRKEVAAVEQWSESLVHQCAALQREIVGHAVECLRPGGFLIYSTCTFNPIENEENAIAIAETYGLEMITLPLPPEWNIAPSCRTGVPALRFMPHITRGEGLFVCVMRKPDEVNREYEDRNLPKGNATSSKAMCNSGKTKTIHRTEQRNTGKVQLPPLPADWLQKQEEYRSRFDGKILSMLPVALDEIINKLKGVKILSAGVTTAELKGREWAPASQLALSTAFNPEAFKIVDVNEETALSYLRHEALQLPDTTTRGFVVIAFKGFPLGMVKNIGNRANNLYPTAWKIRHL